MTSAVPRERSFMGIPSPTIYGLPQDEDFLRRLRHAEKLRTVGLMTGGVAHDFNNVLSVIVNYAHFVEDALDPADPAREDVREIIQAGVRATTLIRQLLALSRAEELIPGSLDVNAALAEMEGFVRRTIGPDINLSVCTCEEKAMVTIDLGHLMQIVMNLSINARDAMPDGGQLVIRSKGISLTADDAARGLCPAPGDYVCVSVTDTGDGIPPSIRDRVFEPFFTTKDPTQGTGLGLSTARGIVVEVGGGISVESHEGRGTTFNVYLPLDSSA